MTLAAAILFLGISSATSISTGAVAPPPPQTSQSAAEPPAGNQGTSSAKTPQSSSEESKPAANQTAAKPTASKKKKPRGSKDTHHARKTATSSCDAAPKNPGSADTSPTPSKPGGAKDETTNAAEAPKNCPPPKIIVRHGGIVEQSIQLAGGAAGDQADQKREATIQMIAATEGNLKKIDGRQLSASQQESVSQIRQFVDQSKSFVAAGDMERAQTLAWKAKLLSDDLVKPQE